MTACDLSSGYTVWEGSQQLATVIMEEFWRQGDEEKKMMYDVANMFDRDLCVPSKALTGFIDFIAEPLFTLWAEFCDTSFTRDICRQIDNNRSHWDEAISV